MGVAALVLTVLSLVALIVGCVWVLMTEGERQRRSGTDVGEEVVASMMEHADSGATVVKAAKFKGEAAAVGAEATFHFSDIKAAVLAGQWRQMLPILMALGGTFGLLIFGSLAVMLLWNVVIGLIFLGAALYATVKTAAAFRRA